MPLRTAAETHLAAAIATATTVGSVRLFSLRHEFPTEWARFTASALSAEGVAPLTVPLRSEHYPFWAVVASPIALRHIDVYAAAGEHRRTVYLRRCRRHREAGGPDRRQHPRRAALRPAAGPASGTADPARRGGLVYLVSQRQHHHRPVARTDLGRPGLESRSRKKGIDREIACDLMRTCRNSFAGAVRPS